MKSGSECLYVIVPCLNEEDTVTSVADEVLAHAPRLPMPVKIMLIEDGSSDRTRERMEDICARERTCSLIVNDKNLGLGRSVMNAYEQIPDGAWVTVLPGDGELVFSTSLDNFMELRGQYDVILGYLQNPVIRPAGRRLASYAFTKVTSSLYGFRWNYLNGLKMYKVEAFRGLEVVSGGHAFMAELLAKAQLRTPALRIGQAPFVARGRSSGNSKAIAPRSVFRAVAEVYAGARSVASYRNEIVRGRAPRGTGDADPR